MRKGFCLSVLLLFVGGCMNVPVKPEVQVRNTDILAEPYETAVGMTVKGLTRLGFREVTVDPERGLVRTESRVTPLGMKDADCGHRWSLPYIDDVRCVTSVAFTVSLENAGETATRITVRPEISGILAATEQSPEQPLECVSLGTMEKRFLMGLSSAGR